MPKEYIQLLIRYLKISARLLDAAVRCQTDATLEAVLNLRSTAEHFRALANKVEKEGLVAAARLHTDFSVTPHAKWLGNRAGVKSDRSVYRNGGRKGGRSKSPSKQRAARENGQNGGRPKTNDGKLIEQLINLAKNPDANPDYSPEVARALLGQIKQAPIRFRREITKRFKEHNIDVKALSLSPDLSGRSGLDLAVKPHKNPASRKEK
jgi:hypothetical protein